MWKLLREHAKTIDFHQIGDEFDKKLRYLIETTQNDGKPGIDQTSIIYQVERYVLQFYVDTDQDKQVDRMYKSFSLPNEPHNIHSRQVSMVALYGEYFCRKADRYREGVDLYTLVFDNAVNSPLLKWGAKERIYLYDNLLSYARYVACCTLFSWI